MKVTVDINVLLDVFQKRQPFEAASAQVLSLVASSKLGAVIPAHGLTTLYYLVRKHSKKVNAERAMDRVLAHFEIGNLDLAGYGREPCQGPTSRTPSLPLSPRRPGHGIS